VRRGQAIAEVTATGSRTYFGRAAELVRLAHARSTGQAAILGATRGLALVNGSVAVLIVLAAAAIGWPLADVMAPLSWGVLAAALAAASGFALVLDEIKRPVMSALGVWQA
jgi:H+-transporting ATPase